MAKLFVAATTNFGDESLANIDTIEFTSAGWGVVATTATFANSQFNNGDILGNVLIDGNSGIQRIAVFGGSVDASGWKFKDWGAEDSILLDGRSTNDKIIGSSQKDIINGAGGNDGLGGAAGNDTIDGGAGDDLLIGGAGIDTLTGGAGNDTFKVGAGSEVAAGEIIDGGSGTDAIQLNNSGNVQLSSATISSIHILDFVAGSSTAFLRGDQISFNPPPDPDPSGDFFSFTVDGGSGADRLVVTGDASLGFVRFTNWSTQDTIALNGAAADNFINGSSQSDVISGLGGGDELFGGGGNDVIVGGAGRDRMGGGGGRDTFDFNDKSESPAFVAGVFSADLITDFADPDGAFAVLDDLIDLSGIDANEALTGNQAFFLDNGNGVQQVGELTFGQRLNAQGAAVTVLMAHTNGDQAFDFAIEFDRVITSFGADDFVL